MSILIQGGCTFIGEGIWEYRYADVTGFHGVRFTSLTTPKIGDSIVDGALVVLTEPMINQDKRMWDKLPDDAWPSKPF